MADTKRYQVVDGPLSIRDAANGNRTGRSLSQGQEVTVQGDAVVAGNYVWLHHTDGWSAMGTADGTKAYMIDISDRDPNAKRRFRVTANVLSIRTAANGLRISAKLYKNNEIEVYPESRTVEDGHIWWQHDKGWSAERNTTGSAVYMKEILETSSTSTTPTTKTPETTSQPTPSTIPATWTGIKELQVKISVKVRNRPSTDSRVMVIKTIARGAVLNCNMDTLTEADGYYWVRHDDGWSAIQSTNGNLVFLVEPGSIPGLIAIGANGPKAKDLPDYRAMITSLPVKLADIQWFQYFGNNMFAMRNGANFGYDRYSQGLHGGLDFGNSNSPKAIFAGLEAEFVKADYSRRNNTKIYLKKGDYTIIYQHITSARQFSPGQTITPDTQLAMIEHHSINNGWDHLHLEIRFMDNWIINPLLLMTEDVYNTLVGRFDPDKPNTGYKSDFPKSTKNFFYHTPTWSKWVTPLDQPMIKLAGDVIGPRAELDKSEW
ncbi:MAG: hypothetical protein AAFV93_13985 [Chloroflexota bacterium]